MLANGPIDAEQLEDILAERIWESTPARTREDYISAFCSQATQYAEAGDAQRSTGFDFLGRLCSLRLDLEDDQTPAVLDSRLNFPTIDTLSLEELVVLREILHGLDDAELKAHVADILWLTRARSRVTHELARLSVQSYVRSARVLYESGHQFGDLHAVDRLVRGLRIAKRLGNNHPAVADAKSGIETLLASREGQPAFPLAGLVGELYNNGLGDPAHYADSCRTLAAVAESEKKWLLASRYWLLSRDWWRRAGNDEASIEASRRAAETNFGEAEAALARPTPSHLVACHFLGLAIHALRAIPRQEARCEGLHNLMLKYQKAGLKELICIESDPVDLKEARSAAEKLVCGKDFQDAVRTLALSAGKPPDVIKLRARVEEMGKSYVGMQIFSNSYLNQWGKTVDTRPAFGVGGKEESESRVLAEMLREARWSREFRALGIIAPMREVIWREHNIRLNDMLPFVSDNSFVPPDRMRLFARGLFAGFVGEFDVAAHLLVPQLENSIRVLLAQREVIVSGFDDNGIQMEFDLNRILTALRPEVEAIFGSDLAFELRGLLVERVGDNFRNEMSHGLLRDAAFFNATTIFVWWITLHLCCIGWMLSLKAREHKDAGIATPDA